MDLHTPVANWWAQDPFYTGHALYLSAFITQIVMIIEDYMDALNEQWEQEGITRELPLDAAFVEWLAAHVPPPLLVATDDDDSRFVRKMRQLQFASWNFWLALPSVDATSSEVKVQAFRTCESLTRIPDTETGAETYIEALNRLARDVWHNYLCSAYEERAYDDAS